MQPSPQVRLLMIFNHPSYSNKLLDCLIMIMHTKCSFLEISQLAETVPD